MRSRATPDDAQKLVDAALADMERIDVLVNSAGINRPQKSEDVNKRVHPNRINPFHYNGGLLRLPGGR